MLFNILLILAIFIGIVITAGSAKYKKDSDEAARKDREDWNRHRNNNSNKKY